MLRSEYLLACCTIPFGRFSIIFALCYIILSAPEVSARGRLMEPTQRSSLWTRGFDSPINDDDTGLNCGGRWAQHGINNGKCGVCGDRYDVFPRQNEPGGTYANGLIANTYTTDDKSILVVVDTQSALGGYFEFRICPHNDPLTSVSQECLDQHQLRVWDVVTQEPGYQYTPKSIGLHRLRVEIPTGMTCTQCVLQWKWHTATDWGRCPDGNARLGCGPQEEFYNCADIKIEQPTDANQRLKLPEVKLTNSNQPMSFEMAQPSFDRQNVLSSMPISFLPHEIFKAGNLGPVIPPKFDFFDPSARSTEAPTTTTTDTTTVAKEIVPIQDLLNTFNNVVELKFNDKTDVVTDSSSSQQTSTSNSEVTYQSTGSTSHSNADITVSSLVPNEISSIEAKPTDSTIVAAVTEQAQTISSSSVPSQTSTSDQPITSTSGNADQSTSGQQDITTSGQQDITTSVQQDVTTSRQQEQSTSGASSTTVDASTAKVANMPAGGIVIPSFALGDIATGGMLVKVGMGADAVPTQDTPIVTSQATSPQETTVGAEEATPTNDQTSTLTTPTREERFLAPIPSIARSMARAPVAVNGRLSRKRRQAAPPPPPPAGGPGPSQPPPAAPPAQPAAPGAGPDYAPKPDQATGASRTISFGGLIGDSFSRSGQTQHSFMTRQDFQQSMGGGAGGGPIPGEALSEMTMTGAQQPSGPVDMQGYPPDMMLAPGPQGAPAGAFDMTGGALNEMYLDPSMTPGGSLLDTPVDANPASFLKPGIPRPPKQSSAELEAAIVGAPVLTGVVSDTHISTNAADLVGASYIPELSEGRSNQAETSTAARHGTMIIPMEHVQKKGGRKVEYLAGSKGTSMRETAADTRAEIRSATMSLARFGYQPTAEQVLSGNIGIHHPTENMDTTNLEPIGPSPTDAVGSAAPGILSAILGGQPTKVTDASLDPAVQKTREDLIRQLGEAMGVIGTGKTATKESSGLAVGGTRGQITSLISAAPQEPQQQVINTVNTQQVVNAQPQVMGVGLDAGMFGMDMGMGMNPNQPSLDMFQGMGMQGLNMQGMDLQSLFGAADAAVNSQAMPQAMAQTAAPQNINQQALVEQSMFGQSAAAAAQSMPAPAVQASQPRQPQSAMDLVDIGMPGMTIEEMMTLLNMEQHGGAAGANSASTSAASASLSAAAQTPTGSSNSAAARMGGMNMETAMMGGTSSSSSQSSASSMSQSGRSLGASSSMESMMLGQVGANSINNKPSVNDKLSGLTAQSLSQMSTSSLEALLLEATGGEPKKEEIPPKAPAPSPSALPLVSSTSATGGSFVLNADSLLTAPLDKLTTAELEALLANAPPTEPPTTTTTTVATTNTNTNAGNAMGQQMPESRQTTRIKAALRQAVFEATGTEFDFSQMTQAEMTDMVQMFGGLQSLAQYMPFEYGPDPFAPEPEPLVPTPAPPAPVTTAAPTPAPAVAVPTDTGAQAQDANIDFAAMQQFLNPAMFGNNFGFGQQVGHEADLSAMMNALNPSGTPLNSVDTISLADLLSGNVNMGGSAQTHSTQVTDAQSAINNVQEAAASGASASQAGGQFGWGSGSVATSGSQTSGMDTASATTQNEMTGAENMIWDPVQMQWIAPNGSVIKEPRTSATQQQAAMDIQSAISNQMAGNTQQQGTMTNEMSSSSASSSTSLTSSTSLSSSSSSSAGTSMTDTLFSMENTLIGSIDPTAQRQNTALGTSTTAVQEPMPTDASPIVGSVAKSATPMTSIDISASSGMSASVDIQGIAQSNLSDLIPIGQQMRAQMTEKSSPSTANVDPSPTISTAGSAIVVPQVQTTVAPIVEAPIPPAGVPNQRERILMNHEMQKKRELEMLLQRQRDELRKLEEQRIEQRRKMMAEKQRIEYEKQQLALRKQQMELDALRQDQLRQRQMIEQQRKQLQDERLRIERQRMQELEAAKQKAIEGEKRRIREEQQRLRELEMAKQQAAERERQRIEMERRKKAQSELARRRAAEQERMRIAEERRRLEEERMRQEAAAAAAAKAKAEAEAAAAAAAAAQAEIQAREQAAAAMVIGSGSSVGMMDTAVVSTNFTSGNASESFTPIGAVGGQLTDADAATAMAWQAVVKAAQIQASGGAADPNAMIAQQQEQMLQHQQLMSMLNSPQGANADWMKILEQATGQTTTPKPTPGAAMGGLDTAALMKLLQEQAQAQATTTTPAPPTTTAKPKRKAPIRPDPNTRDFVRNMFIDNMQPGVDPLSILIGLTPEMLMKSGVNPLIANSGDLARIVPAVERALGVSLKKIPIPTGPGGRPLAPQPTGIQMLNVRSGPGGAPGSAGSQRREFLMQQRMMSEMMTMLGMGPEPLEPGDPGYTGPGATPGGPGGRAGARAARMGGHSLGGHSMGGGGGGMGGHSLGGGGGGMGGHSFGGGGEMGPGGGMRRGGRGGPMGAGGPGAGLSAQMEMLGL